MKAKHGGPIPVQEPKFFKNIPVSGPFTNVKTKVLKKTLPSEEGIHE